MDDSNRKIETFSQQRNAPTNNLVFNTLLLNLQTNYYFFSIIHDKGCINIFHSLTAEFFNHSIHNKVRQTTFSNHSLKYFEIILNSHSSFKAFVQEKAVQKYKQHSPFRATRISPPTTAKHHGGEHERIVDDNISTPSTSRPCFLGFIILT